MNVTINNYSSAKVVVREFEGGLEINLADQVDEATEKVLDEEGTPAEREFEQAVTDVVVKQIEKGGPIFNALRRATNLQRKSRR